MESGTPSDKVMEGQGAGLLKITLFSYTAHSLKNFIYSTSPGKLKSFLAQNEILKFSWL